MNNTQSATHDIEQIILTAAIGWTFAFYLFGALYLIAPAIGWLLLLLLIKRWVTNQLNYYPGAIIYLWLIAMLAMQIILLIGHVDFDLGLTKIIKSSIGWAKGWALIAIFPLLGYCLNIQMQHICRAACVIGMCALIITPFLFLAYKLGLPGYLYTSPLKVIGGSGPEFFSVILYEIDPGLNRPRWRYFAPWAPAVGFVGNIYFLCALFEKNKKWRWLGISGNLLMILLAFSRLGLITLILIPAFVWLISRIYKPWVLFTGTVFFILIAIFGEQLIDLFSQTLATIKDARPDSTRVRGTLGNIALHRWQNEAFWFGHGIVERGSHLVEFMPIGSHHTWYGLLFVKGLSGFLSLAIPLTITVCALLYKAQFNRPAKLALGMCFILLLFSFGENLEALAYLTWPAWLLIGIGLRGEQI